MVSVPELLAPAGSLDAVRAALANGADAVYLGAERFNARDEGAQLTIDELEEACRLARSRGKRIYLTLNTLLKPSELSDALTLLGECLDRGIDAAIIQDLGLVRLAQRVFPGIELHGSTQLTVHDEHGAALLRELGLQRVVLARENTLDDIRAIHSAVPELLLETFIHGALCISYSGQCLMSGMISERSANRGSCAQSCRKDYTLTDAATGQALDQGYLISARDLAAHEHLEDIARSGVHTLKIEGRKKRPEYVATVTRTYRGSLERVARGEPAAPSDAEQRDLVQIYSRGFTGGMYGGRAGRDYVTRDHPDNRGATLGVVVGHDRGALVVEVSSPLEPGDGVAFRPPNGMARETTGFTIAGVRTIRSSDGVTRQAVGTHTRVPAGFAVVRTSHAALLARARESFAPLHGPARPRRTRLEAQVFGAAGMPLDVVFTAGSDSARVRGDVPLAPARTRALDQMQLREQFGRLGETPFALGAIDDAALAPGLFVPVRELNGLRQRAVAELLQRRDWSRQLDAAARRAAIDAAILDVPNANPAPVEVPVPAPATLAADVYTVDDAHAAAHAGATEISFDPFLRHPVPPRARVQALHEFLNARGITLRLRTPTIVRPEERPDVQKWLDLGLPILTGHLGLLAALARDGNDVVADYAVNCFNQHSAAQLFQHGARRIVLSVELTTGEIADVAAPWSGRAMDVVVYGRPEGMTIEHCVLSAAFDRQPTTCRDLCVQKHPLVELTDPAGYTFPVATDAACRNRLLHSRPIEGSEFLPQLWRAGIRGYRLVFNVPGDPVYDLVARYREALAALSEGSVAKLGDIRAVVGSRFTRGHFARAV